MSLHRTSDQLSRCDPGLYSNIYDTRKRPDLKPEALANPHPIHKDTIEISHDKLKEDALNRLRHTTTKTIAQNGFMRIGKYLFLAIAFPPYLLVYGLPKWIIVEALPALASLCSAILAKLKNKTKKQTEVAVNKVTQVIQFLQNVARELMKPAVRLIMKIRQGIDRFRERGQQFLNRFKERSNKALNAPFIGLTARYKRIQNKLKQVKEWAFKQIETSREGIQKGVEWIKQAPMLMLGWGQTQFQHLSGVAISWKQKWVNRYQASESKAERATNWIFQRCKNVKQGIKGLFEPLTSFCKLQIMPRWRRFQEVFSGKLGKVAEFLGQRQRRALAYLQDKQEKLKKLSYGEIVDRLFSNALMKSLPLRVQEWLKRWLYRPFVESVLSRILKVIVGGSALMLKAAHWMMFGVSKWFGWVPQLLIKLAVYCRLAFGVCAGACDTGLNYFFTVIRKGIYYTLLFTVMGLIICTLVMRSCARLTKYMTKRISQSMFSASS